MICPNIIGRDSQLNVIEKALAEMIPGRPQTLLMAGEAGMGKTRPVAEIHLRVKRLRSYMLCCIQDSICCIIVLKRGLSSIWRIESVVMVLTVEPDVATSHGTFHVEEDVVVTESGYELLYACAWALRTLGF